MMVYGGRWVGRGHERRLDINDLSCNWNIGVGWEWKWKGAFWFLWLRNVRIGRRKKMVWMSWAVFWSKQGEILHGGGAAVLWPADTGRFCVDMGLRLWWPCRPVGACGFLLLMWLLHLCVLENSLRWKRVMVFEVWCVNVKKIGGVREDDRWNGRFCSLVFSPPFLVVLLGVMGLSYQR